MASAIFNPPYLSHPSSSSLILPKIVRKPPIHASLFTRQIPCPRTPIIRSLTLAPFSNWNGLRKTGFSISLQSFKLEKRKKCKGKGVFASLFGVGAPEALVIGVVALLVFGPKGLAEVAKTMGKTLRSFQPTIRELQEVSREFKSTLEKEIGLDELKNPVQGNYTSNTVTPPPAATTTTTEDSQATTTAPAGSPEDSQDSLTASDVSREGSQETVTTSDVSPEGSQETVTTTDVSPEDSQETTVPAVTMEDSQPTVDTTNGTPSSKAYSSEDLLKITEEQLKAVASQQQKDQPPSPENPQGEI
ncbi:hypothetical protein L1987_43105 [Smallanthus sonchifolius]|uniref:Uncharacterized protein n=1 Tax=Smallanthus sonchifolius TaxID=185202 RepID=A0ACB9GK68_9ASTR|nr:hypothetical protein L1987_43105 [Smallanthus sonchifolius]